LASAVVAKAAKTLTLVYSGAIAGLQTWNAGAWTILDSLGASTVNGSTATAASATQVITIPTTSGLTIGSGTITNPNTAGIQDSLGRVLDPVSGFPVTINA
jgi:hypothetical protein